LALRTEAPATLLRSELGERHYALLPGRFDCGTLGPDSTSVDLAATLTVVESVLDANETRVEEEIALLRSAGARIVVSDIPAFPLRVAQIAGAPR